jgi:hypothetical protein
MSDRRGYSELANGDDVHCFCRYLCAQGSFLAFLSAII